MTHTLLLPVHLPCCCAGGCIGCGHSCGTQNDHLTWCVKSSSHNPARNSRRLHIHGEPDQFLFSHKIEGFTGHCCCTSIIVLARSNGRVIICISGLFQRGAIAQVLPALRTRKMSLCFSCICFISQPWFLRTQLTSLCTLMLKSLSGS